MKRAAPLFAVCIVLAGCSSPPEPTANAMLPIMLEQIYTDFGV